MHIAVDLIMLFFLIKNYILININLDISTSLYHNRVKQVRINYVR